MRLYVLQFARIAVTGTPCPGYLIQTDDGRHVLVDTGVTRRALHDPERVAAEMRTSPPVDELTANAAATIAGAPMGEEDFVVNRLAALGLNPCDIDYLVCTHFDWDHAGNHDLFPAAEFVVQRRHYELARTHPRLRLCGAPWDTPGLRYRLVDGDAALLPGITLLETSGHVPGHQSILVRLPETGPVILAADAILWRSQLDPEDPPHRVDMDHEAKRASIGKLVAVATKEGAALIVFGHDAEQWRELRKSPDYYT